MQRLPEISQATEKSMDQITDQSSRTAAQPGCRDYRSGPDEMSAFMPGNSQKKIGPAHPGQKQNTLENRPILKIFPPAERARAKEILDLARASYRLRDDDNISQDKIRKEHRRSRISGEGTDGEKDAWRRARKPFFQTTRQQSFHPSATHQSPLCLPRTLRHSLGQHSTHTHSSRGNRPVRETSPQRPGSSGPAKDLADFKIRLKSWSVMPSTPP